jgi:hypothetical protein
MNLSFIFQFLIQFENMPNSSLVICVYRLVTTATGLTDWSTGGNRLN